MSENQKIKYLEPDKVLEVLHKVLENESEIKVAVKSSKSSFSIYFRIYKGTRFVSRRISDHSTSKDIKTLLVGPTTKYKHVESFIRGAIKDLKRIYKKSLFRQIEEQMKNGENTNSNSNSNETTESEEGTTN